jgi:threonine dehydrogenase-like Zn-dependent dehydrogenase
MKRRAAKLVGPRKFEIVEEPIRPLGDHEVLMRVLSCGLCHSEMPAFHGESRVARTPEGIPYMDRQLKYPFEIGHEPSGVVEDVGKAVKGLKAGDYVSGLARGVFATHAYADPATLLKLPPGVKDPKYCLIEPLTAICNNLRAANPEYGDTVAVIGCGMMGLMVIAGLKRSAAKEIIAIDLIDFRLDWAKRLGATKTMNPKKGDIVAEIQELTHGQGVDVAIEISGKLAGLGLALDIIKNASLLGYQGRGKILLPSLYAEKQVWEPSYGYQLMFKSPILHSTHPWYSRDYREDQRRALWGYLNGLLPLNQIITHEFRLEEIEKGFETAETGAGNYIKGIVVPA